jgi:hypothetical protein
MPPRDTAYPRVGLCVPRCWRSRPSSLLAATGALGLWYWYERQAASRGAEHSGQVIEALDLVMALPAWRAKNAAIR